ncbi:MAG: hypothetical protein ACO3RV_08720, partial [Luteolibacter sp.]
TGGPANTLTGDIRVHGGQLDVLDGQSLTNVSGTITVTSGAAFNYSKNFANGNDLTNAISLSGSGNGSMGALNLRGNATATGNIQLTADTLISHDFNNATISGPVIGNDPHLTLRTLPTSVPQPGMTVTGPVRLGKGGITIQGAANSGNFSIRLTGNNSYSGETHVVSGTLMLSGSARIDDTAAVRIDSGAVLHLDFNGIDTLGSLILDGISMPEGSYGSLTSAADNKSALFAGNGILQVGSVNNYASWAASQIPPITGGENGDHDKDGIPNLMEYALADAAERGVLSGTTITFTKRGAPYGSDLTYIIETSDTLSESWTPILIHGPTELNLPLSLNLSSTPATPKNFARLKVVKTQ